MRRLPPGGASNTLACSVLGRLAYKGSTWTRPVPCSCPLPCAGDTPCHNKVPAVSQSVSQPVSLMLWSVQVATLENWPTKSAHAPAMCLALAPCCMLLPISRQHLSVRQTLVQTWVDWLPSTDRQLLKFTEAPWLLPADLSYLTEYTKQNFLASTNIKR